MLTVFTHELREQVWSLRFQVSLVVLLLFFAANGVVYALKLGRQVEEEARVAADVETTLTDAATVGAAASRWYRALGSPAGTEFIAEGGFHWFADAAWVNPASGEGVVAGTRVRTTNHWIRRFEIVDWTLVVRLVVSFLGIVLAYDAISGDLERGTLRQLLANPLSRGRLLAGRVLAQWVTLLAAVAVGSGVSLLTLVLCGAVAIDGRLAAAVGLFLAATALYAALFLLLAAGVSALARSSATSLVLLVLAWAVLIVIVPQTAYLAVSGATDVESTRDLWDRANQMQREREEVLVRQGIQPRAPADARADDYALERQYARHLQDLERDQGQLAREVEARQVRQFEAARGVSLLSPGFAFQYSVEALLGTGPARRQDLLAQAWRYRESLRQHLRGLDAADPESPHVLFLAQFMSDAPFDAARLPRFRQRPVPFARGVAAGAVPIAALCLEAILALGFALWAFRRLELTGVA